MTFIKGFIIGIGKIIPGVSGGLIAVLLGEYKKMIYSLNHIKSNYKYLIEITLGITFSIVVFSSVISFLLNNYYLSTILLFLGLMLGEIPQFYKKIKKRDLIFSIISFILCILIFKSKIIINTDTFVNKFVLGTIESISTIIPGISGTAIYMLLDVYETVLYYISNIININMLGYNLHFFIPFGLGLILMSILLIRVLNTLYIKYESKINGTIFGLMLYSILYLLLDTFNKNYNIIEIIISLLLFVTGFIVSKYIVTKIKI